MLAWKGDASFVAGKTTFHALAEGAFSVRPDVELGEGEFAIAKPRWLVDRYAALLNELKPRQVVELGAAQGGSTLFLTEVARPQRLAAIDREPLDEAWRRVERQAQASDLSGVVQSYGGVDQQDRRRLAEVVDEAFDGAALDLVVDDGSHLYGPTRASFNELFPRLRPGGAYMIEAWAWAHARVGAQQSEGLFPGEVPLTQLLFEIVLAIPGMPGLIENVSIAPGLTVIWRGGTEVEPGSFDVSACSNPRGRALLATPASPSAPDGEPSAPPVRNVDKARELLADLPRLHFWDDSPQIGGLNSAIGERIIAELERYDSPRVVETGAGGTTLLFCCLGAAELTSIAPNASLFDRIRAEASERRISVDRARFLCERSEVALPRLAADNARFDVALIDGTHNWPGVFVDFCYFNMMMSAGATLFVDDVHLYSVSQLYRLLLGQEDFECVALDGKFATFRKLTDSKFLPEWTSEPYIADNSPASVPSTSAPASDPSSGTPVGPPAA
jgi:Methyltransferase domain